MDLLTLAELMTLVRMLAELVGSIDKINSVVESHIARRLLKPAVVEPAPNSGFGF
jgi:hypothetical protein